jgi:hypothetical protein
VHRAGIASSLETTLPGLAAGASTSARGDAISIGARGDILLAMPQAISIVDVLAVHPLSLYTLTVAAVEAGAAAAR